MFAVIKTGGKQYRVAENDVITVERVAGEAGDMVEFGEVLMVSAGVEVSFGAPAVAGALVTAEIVEQFRDAKVLSFKKRRRQNSKRIRGHRQMLTSLRISEILTDGAKPSKKAAARKPAKAETSPATETAQVAAPVAEKAEKKAPKAKAASEKPADDKPAAPKKAAKPKAAKKEDKGE